MLDRVLENFGAFCDYFGLPLFPWQREAFGEFGRREGGRFVHGVGGISVPRGDGKSYGEGCYGTWRLMTAGRGADLISVALDEDGGHVVLDHARQLRRRSPALQTAIEERANALLVPSTGARWTVEPSEHLSTRGRHPTLVLYDEPGWAAGDELFASLLAAQASVVDAQMLLASTVGVDRKGPLSKVKALAETGEAYWYYRTANQSPLVTPEFLARQRRILTPQQFAREHENRLIDGVDSFTTAADVRAAMIGEDAMPARRDLDAALGVDIGLVDDPAVIVVVVRDGGIIIAVRIITFQGSREHPVQLDAIERTILDLRAAWRVLKVRIESWQGVQLCQRLQARGVPVEQVHPTARLHANEWPTLAARLTSRTLVLPRHEQLREELLGLTTELTATGIRVTDRGRVHQDHATALRLAVAGLAPVSADAGVIELSTGRYCTMPEYRARQTARSFGIDPDGATTGDPVLARDPLVRLPLQRG